MGGTDRYAIAECGNVHHGDEVMFYANLTQLKASEQLVLQKWFISLTFSVIVSYQCFQFHLISLHSLRDILQTSRILPKSNKGDNKTGKPETESCHSCAYHFVLTCHTFL